jgi:hypothetical protein
VVAQKNLALALRLFSRHPRLRSLVACRCFSWPADAATPFAALPALESVRLLLRAQQGDEDSAESGLWQQLAGLGGCRALRKLVLRSTSGPLSSAAAAAAPDGWHSDSDSDGSSCQSDGSSLSCSGDDGGAADDGTSGGGGEGSGSASDADSSANRESGESEDDEGEDDAEEEEDEETLVLPGAGWAALLRLAEGPGAGKLRSLELQGLGALDEGQAGELLACLGSGLQRLRLAVWAGDELCMECESCMAWRRGVERMFEGMGMRVLRASRVGYTSAVAFSLARGEAEEE